MVRKVTHMLSLYSQYIISAKRNQPLRGCCVHIASGADQIIHCFPRYFADAFIACADLRCGAFKLNVPSLPARTYVA